MAYPTLAELRGHVGIGASDTTEDTRLTSALTVAIADVESYCGRKFTQDGSVSARVFRAGGPCHLYLPAGSDISTTTGLVVKTDDTGTGTYGTTWTITTDFILEPHSGVGYDGATGWPYTILVAVGSRLWPDLYGRPGIEITAKWGWAAVPSAVAQAVLLHAAQLWKLKDAPFGVTGGDLLGPQRGVRENAAVAALLARYQHRGLAAIA